jgi:hypothetical protein
VLSQEGFITTYPVGEENNFYQWEYELTPAGLAEIRKVRVVHQWDTILWRAMGTDGQLYQRGEQVFEEGS